jgi:pentatricopeptide repeat protein
VINACAEVRDVAKAEHWLSEMKKACASAREVAKAERWLSEMIKLDVKVDTVAYNNRG